MSPCHCHLLTKSWPSWFLFDFKFEQGRIGLELSDLSIYYKKTLLEVDYKLAGFPFPGARAARDCPEFGRGETETV